MKAMIHADSPADVGRHIRIFDLIAPIYSWFFPFQIRIYRRLIARHSLFFGGHSSRVLDIGCGTGALAYVLSESGYQVTGLDGSERMIAVARRLNRGNTAQFRIGNALDLFPDNLDESIFPEHEGEVSFSSQQYDIVVASYVLHGLQKDQRQKLYAAMKHLALKRVIIMDYNHRRGSLTSLAEWLEQGDYFNFIKSAADEMRQIFPNVQVIQTGKQAAWYVCDCARS
jgi:SAM-dependent methyltransferase